MYRLYNYMMRRDLGTGWAAYASEFGETEEILKTRAAVDKFAAEVLQS